jgi:hypothetical protein
VLTRENRTANLGNTVNTVNTVISETVIPTVSAIAREVSQMNKTIRFLLLVVAVNCPTFATAIEYTFSRIYLGTVNEVVDAGVAINDNGLVAYCTSHSSVGPWSLITSDGHSSTALAGPTGPNYLDNSPTHESQVLSVNNHGVVAFRGCTADGKYGVLVSDGTTTRKIAAESSTGGSFYALPKIAMSINDSGVVAFTGKQTSSSGYRIFLGDGTAAPAQLNNRDAYYPAINNGGVVAYHHWNGTSPPRTTEIQNGVQYLVLDDGNQSYTMPDINSLGVAAACTGGPGSYKVAIGDGVSGTTYIDGSSYYYLSSAYAIDGITASCAINDHGLVAFGAVPSSASPYAAGIYTGADPVADKVIAPGDMLDGVTVGSVVFTRNGLNNRGQIAFRAALTDNRVGIWVATPVPEPSTCVLMATGTGSVLIVALRRRGRKRSKLLGT